MSSSYSKDFDKLQNSMMHKLNCEILWAKSNDIINELITYYEWCQKHKVLKGIASNSNYLML